MNRIPLPRLYSSNSTIYLSTTNQRAEERTIFITRIGQTIKKKKTKLI